MSLTSKSKLTLWVDSQLVKLGKQWAEEHRESLSQVVSNYLARLVSRQEKSSPITPAVRHISGILKGKKLDRHAYHQHLEKKYLGA